MDDQSDGRSLVAIAMQWVSRITAVGLEMVLPGLLGLWLDSLLGTRYILAIVGFLLGMVFGMWHLLRMVR